MYNIRKIIVSFIRKRRGIENGGFIMFKANTTDGMEFMEHIRR